MHRHAVASLACTIPFICGCGAELVPISGKVMIGDKPLNTGTVTYHPDESKGNTSGVEPNGKIRADGSYTLHTRGSKGVAPGWYKVTVIAQMPSNPKDPYAPPIHLISKQYTQAEDTPLSVEVKPNAPKDHYNLKVVPRR